MRDVWLQLSVPPRQKALPTCALSVRPMSASLQSTCTGIVNHREQRQEVIDETTIAERQTWPACFWNAGIAPLHPDIVAPNLSLGDFCYEEARPPNREQEDIDAEWIRESRAVVVGDGACTNQGTPIARAGCGAYYGPEHSHNFAFKLEGPAQDSDRAELRAFLRVARWPYAPTEYFTDNEAVCIGFYKLLDGHRTPWQDHKDLWDLVRRVFDAKGSDLMVVSHV